MENNTQENNMEFLVSMTTSVTDKNPTTITEEQLVELIRSDTQLERQTEEHRYLASLNLTKEADKIKSHTLRFLAAGRFEGGTGKANVIYYNGHGMVDIDDVTPENLSAFMLLLATCPFVHIAYVTISGFGIRIIYLTDATDEQQHPIVFSTGNKFFSEFLHCQEKEVDAKCKNINRMSGLAHDANVIYNPNSERFHIPSVTEIEQAKKETKAIQRKHHNQKLYAEKAGVKAQAILATEGKRYEEGSYNAYASAAVFLMNKFGVEKDETLAWSKITFDDYNPADLESIVRSVYENHSDEHGTMPMQTQGKRINVGELEEFIASQADLRYNTITGFNEIRWKDSTEFTEMTDNNENTLWTRSMKAGLFCHPANILSIVHSEFVPSFNPVTNYLESLPQWDGATDYIAQVASRVETDTPEVFEEYFRKWFVAMVASMLDVKIVNHCILMLIGEQGTYKTTFFALLLPPELQRYYSMKINMGYITKDDLFRLSESALICLEEVDALSPASINQLKAMVTIPNINERPAYGRNKELRYHLATFCGTGNNEFFLTDDTGSRRWLNFKVKSILNSIENPLPYEGLYAQAVYLFRNGFRYWFSDEEIKALQEHNRAFEVINLEEQLICTHYRIPKPGEKGIFVPTADILQKINLFIKYPLSINKVAKIMKKLGFISKRLYDLRGFIVIELTDDEKQQRRNLFQTEEAQPELPF